MWKVWVIKYTSGLSSGNNPLFIILIPGEKLAPSYDIPSYNTIVREKCCCKFISCTIYYLSGKMKNRLIKANVSLKGSHLGMCIL